MLKAVIFDMDGVIIDSEPIHFKVEKRLFEDLGLAISDDEHHSFVGTTSRWMWSYIKDKYNLDQSIEELVQMEATSYIDHLSSQKDEKPIPGVVDLIQELHGNNVRLAVASSASVRNIDIVLKMFNLEKLFEARVSGDEVRNGKPAPDVFLHCAKISGLRPCECIVIEDSKNGAEAAKAAGMMCIGFKNPNSGEQDLSATDIVIHSFSELGYRRLRQVYEGWLKGTR
jgi:beta-phosphoglucomutase family hydrolase